MGLIRVSDFIVDGDLRSRSNRLMASHAAKPFDLLGMDARKPECFSGRVERERHNLSISSQETRYRTTSPGHTPREFDAESGSPVGEKGPRCSWNLFLCALLRGAALGSRGTALVAAGYFRSSA